MGLDWVNFRIVVNVLTIVKRFIYKCCSGSQPVPDHYWLLLTAAVIKRKAVLDIHPFFTLFIGSPKNNFDKQIIFHLVLPAACSQYFSYTEKTSKYWNCILCLHLCLVFSLLLLLNSLISIDVSGIIEKFNLFVTLTIVPRMANINRAFWLVHIFIKTLHSQLGRRISLLYHVY